MKVALIAALLLAVAYTAQADECLPEVSAICPAEDPSYAIHLVDPENCAGFCECDSGVAYKLVCSDDLLFNEDLSVCDFPENVDCGTRP